MIPGLNSGNITEGSVAGASKWTASWAATVPNQPQASVPSSQPASTNHLPDATFASTLVTRPNPTPHTGSNTFGFSALAAMQQHVIELDDESDEYDPEPPAGDHNATQMVVDLDNENEDYEPEIPSPSTAYNIPETVIIDDVDDAQEEYEPEEYEPEEYEPEEYDPEIDMDIDMAGASKIYDSDGRASVVSDVPPSGIPDNSRLGATKIANSLNTGASLTDNQSMNETISNEATLLEETRKKALGAILRLWPLDVRFQQYLDEGIDATIVKELFQTLHLDPNAVAREEQPLPLSSSEVNLVPVSAQPTSTPTTDGESRKDRIARLLATKKTGSTPVPTEQKVASVEVPGVKVAGGKGDLIKKKLAALEAQRVQKLRVHNTTQGSTTVSSNSGSYTPVAPAKAVSTASRARVIPRTNSLIIDVSSSEEESENEEVSSGHSGGVHSQLSHPNDSPQVQSLESEISKLKAQIAEKQARKSESGTSSPAVAVPGPSAETMAIPTTPNGDDTTVEPSVPKIPEVTAVTKSKSSRRQSHAKAILAEKMARLKVVNEEAMKLLKEIQVAKQQTDMGLSDESEAEGSADVEGGNKAPPEEEADSQQEEGEVQDDIVPATVETPKNTTRDSCTPVPISANAYYTTDTANMSKRQRKRLKARQRQEAEEEKQRLKAQEAEKRRAEQEEKKRQVMAKLAERKRLIVQEQEQKKANEKDLIRRQMAERAAELKKSLLAKIRANKGSTVNTPNVETPEEVVDSPVAITKQTIPDTSSSEASSECSSESESENGNEDGDTEMVEAEYDPEVGPQVSVSDTTDKPASPVLGLPSVDSVLPAQATEEEVTDDHPMDVSSDSSDDDEEYSPQLSPKTGEDITMGESTLATEGLLQPGSPVVVSEDSEDEEYDPEAGYDPEELKQALGNDLTKSSTSNVDEPQQVDLTRESDSDAEDDSDVMEIDEVGLPVNVLGQVAEVYDAIAAPVNPKHDTAFVPYESIYKGTPDYVFHESFLDDTRGGLRSFTYSNSIDPKWGICTDDLVGQCNMGGNCSWQHLDSCRVGDPKIILRLGNMNGLPEAERAQFKKGLREIIVKKQTGASNDLDALGAAIIQYRREFLKDKSRVRMEPIEL